MPKQAELDKAILKECPNLVLEGMTIAAKATGAEHGILYLRAEYSYMRSELEDVLAKRRKGKLLGKAILGEKDFNFDIEIRLGAWDAIGQFPIRVGGRTRYSRVSADGEAGAPEEWVAVTRRGSLSWGDQDKTVTILISLLGPRIPIVVSK